eukprot:g2243.t1
MVLWRHECSRYASSSRIGYHPNHPSASHPSSRPSSAATILRPFSAGRVSQQSSKRHHHHQQRASSAISRRPASIQEGGVGDTGASWDAHNADGDSGAPATGGSGGRIRGSSRSRPRSAIPRLGAGTGGGADDAYELLVAGPHPERGFSASAARGDDNLDVSGGVLAGGGRRPRSTSARSRSPMDRRTNLAHEGGGGGGGGGGGEEGDEFLDEIYEDLDDEDDGELDNRISIMETRFSTVGRERPDSAVGDNGGANGGSDLAGVTQLRQRRSNAQRATTVSAANAVPRSATSQRPPRAPIQPQHRQMSAGSQTTRRQLAPSARTDEPDTGDGATQELHPSHPSTAIRDNMRPPRVIRSRPTSAPVDGSMIDQDQRRGRGRDPMAPLHARWRRLQMSAGARDGDGRVGGVDTGQQQRARPVRDVTTAVPSWDRDAGNNRPLSSATEGRAVITAIGRGSDDGVAASHRTPSESVTTPVSSRPSSAAFRGWMKARPGAGSAVSAVSSARTLGMDDPELAHLQLEMESRRGALSEAGLARMEDHYTAVILKNSNQRLRRRGRPTSPRKQAGRAKSPRKRGKGASSKSRSKSRSKSPRKGRKKNGNGKKRPRRKGEGRGGGGAGKRRGGSTGEPSTASKKKAAYASAGEFMAAHFPSEGRQGMSLLGMEQEEECQHAFEALSRAGVKFSSSALRRALVIPTDRPIETCLAGLPAPLEGLRDAPYPAPPPPLRLPIVHRSHPPSSGLSPARAAGVAVGTALALINARARNKSPIPGPGKGGVFGGRGRPPARGGGRGRKKTGAPRR